MYFLAGVAEAEIFKGDEPFVTARTLIDSSITIGVSAEDIRAGKGAKLYGKYFHTSSFDLKLSDAMFKMEYIAANVGADLELGGDVFYMEDVSLKAGENNITLREIPLPMVQGGKPYIYYKKDSDDFFKTIIGDGSNMININVERDGVYCFRYLYTNDSAFSVNVNANFTPDTLCVFLTANLYAGDIDDISQGTKVGEITIKVPRFLLSGSQDITLSMTGFAETAIEGSALAFKENCCDGSGIYAEIIEVIFDRTYNDLSMIKVEIDEDGIVLFENESELIRVYGRYSNTGLTLVGNDLLTYTIEDESICKIENGIITGLNVGHTFLTVSINDYVKDVVVVTVLSSDIPYDPDEPIIDWDNDLVYVGITEDGEPVYLTLSDLEILDELDDVYLSYY